SATLKLSDVFFPVYTIRAALYNSPALTKKTGFFQEFRCDRPNPVLFSNPSVPISHDSIVHTNQWSFVQILQLLTEGPKMENVHDTNFVVYLGLDKGHAAPPEALEHPVPACSTYAEAREILNQGRQEAKDCVIRYEGIAGGGD